MRPRTKGWRANPSPRRKWGINTTLSPDFGVGMTYPGVGSLCVISAVKYLASRRSLMSFSVMEEAIHLPWEPYPAMSREVGVKGKIGIGALELEDVEAGREEGAGKRDRSLSFYKGSECQATPPRP